MRMPDILSGISAPVWGWLIFAVVMMLIEMMTMGLTTIWAAGGAIAAVITALLTDSLMVQGLVFAIVTLFFVIVTRPLAVRKLNSRTVKTNIDALIGKEAVVESDADSLSPGQVRAEGKVWTAVPAEGSDPVRKGDIVTIAGVEGVKLIVSKKQ